MIASLQSEKAWAPVVGLTIACGSIVAIVAIICAVWYHDRFMNQKKK